MRTATFGAVALFAWAAQAGAANGPVDQSFAVRKVHIDNMVAQVTFETAPAGGQVRIQANGKIEVLKRLEVRAVGDEVVLHLAEHPDGDAWFPWNLFNKWSSDEQAANLQIKIIAPTGTPVEIEDMIGSIVAGDLDAPLTLEGAAVTARFGRTTSARVSVAGAGKIDLGPVRDTLDIEVAGSGDVNVASASAARFEIAGGGDIKLGAIAGTLDGEVAGAGDVRIASVNGRVDLSIAGSGNVVIDGGRATPLNVEIAGSGDIVFHGEAVDPKVAIMGSGSVKVKSYTGRQSVEIMGSGSFDLIDPKPTTQSQAQ